MQNIPNTDYYESRKYNNQKFMELIKVNMPEFYILADMVTKCQANPSILFHVIKHMGEIANGTGFGQVHIVIEEGVARFVRGEHSTRLNEPVIFNLGESSTDEIGPSEKMG